jgi:hypothetical protein
MSDADVTLTYDKDWQKTVEFMAAMTMFNSEQLVVG